jgi:hypothetical protein
MIVRVFFPGCSVGELHLDVLEESMIATSSKFRLNTFLPRPVDAENGAARWNSEKCELQVLLPLR